MIKVSVSGEETQNNLEVLAEFVRSNANMRVVRIRVSPWKNESEGEWFAIDSHGGINLVMSMFHINGTKEDVKPLCYQSASPYRIVSTDSVYIISDRVAVVHEYSTETDASFAICIGVTPYKEPDTKMLNALAGVGVRPIDAMLIMAKTMYCGVSIWE